MGPMRIVPGQKVLNGQSDLHPMFSEEPPEMKESKLCPLPAGADIFRDLRTWHGDTPNLSNTTRFLPSAGGVVKGYLPTARDENKRSFGLNRCLPKEQSLEDTQEKKP